MKFLRSYIAEFCAWSQTADSRGIVCSNSSDGSCLAVSNQGEASETSQKAKLACFTVYSDWHIVKKLLYVQSSLYSISNKTQTWPLVRREKVDGAPFVAILWFWAL